MERRERFRTALLTDYVDGLWVRIRCALLPLGTERGARGRLEGPLLAFLTVPVSTVIGEYAT